MDITMKIKKRFVFTFIAFLLSLLPGISHAVFCAKDAQDGQVAVTDNLPENISVSPTATEGTVIWRSDRHTYKIVCSRSSHDMPNEYLYFWINPRSQVLAPGVEVGIVYNDVTHTNSNGAISTGFSTSNWEASFSLSYAIVLLKKGAAPASGVVNISNYSIFQIDGIRGINSLTGKNLNQLLNGKITFSGGGTCSINAGDVNIAVRLGTIKASSFTGVGSTSPSQSFKIGLSCQGGEPNATTTVSATLTDQTAPGNRSDQLTLTPASTAQGVAVQVLRDSTVLKYGPDSNAPDNVNQWQAGTTGNGKFDISLAARYIQTTSTVSAGSANAKATITMSYR